MCRWGTQDERSVLSAARRSGVSARLTVRELAER